MRIGLFGGSFDPVHYGHLHLAECSREQAGLDQVWFVPTALAPHKQDAQPASAADRLAMLELATADHPDFRVEPIEVARGGVSYTVDTLQAIRERLPKAELFLLMGGDSLADFPSWRGPDEICRLAQLLVLARPDAPPPDWTGLQAWLTAEQLDRQREFVVQAPLMELSSTEMRRRVAAGQSIRYHTPPAVIDYIAQHALYQ